MSGHTDLKTVSYLCYNCNNREDCCTYKKWIQSDFIGMDQIDVVFGVIRCKTYIPDNFIDIKRSDYESEIVYRTKR